MGDIIFHLTVEEQRALTLPAGITYGEYQKLVELDNLNRLLGPKPDKQLSRDGYGAEDGAKK